jgi:hypothetical protein
MVFATERVRETFTTSVVHDDLDALIMLEGKADVPHVQCVKPMMIVGWAYCASTLMPKGAIGVASKE